MNEYTFDPIQFYASYPNKVIARPGYPARAAYKSTLMFGLYGQCVLNDIGTIATYADIGGCFGFGANSMAFQISKRQGTSPKTVVFELSEEFVRIGKLLLPNVVFVKTEFRQWNGDVSRFDLISLFDVVEHIVDPETFLRQVSARSKYVMLITPLETSGILRGNKPPVCQGKSHPDGHVNFFTARGYESLLDAANLDIVSSRLVLSIVPPGADAFLTPESFDPGFLSSFMRPKKLIFDVLRRFPSVTWQLMQKFVGHGNHLCLCRSRSFN